VLQAALKPEERPLLKPLQKEEVALFVGSGVSRWAGLPSWPELLTALLDKCRALGGSAAEAETALARKDMIGAAGQLCDQMSSSEIASVFRRTLKFGKAKPHRIHRLIFSLGIRRFVTTNYDNLLEKQAVRSYPITPFLTVTNRKLAELADIQKAAANHFIFKSHGDLSDAESLIVSEAHYRSIFGDADSPVK
jgi:SIR2-like domain